MASWIAAGTSYANTGVPMVPFYTFYSMFGFQRIGDLAWLAADARTRGFLIGATAGRTTLMGEGLQHQDGHSLLLASTIPACEAYDPAFAFELGAIIEEGLNRMYPDGSIDGEDVFYYITVYNENYEQPSQPDHVDNRDITSGLYKFDDGPDLVDDAHRATILFSGPSYLAAKEAQTILAEQYNVAAELWSVTSYKRLREDAINVQRRNRLNPLGERLVPMVTSKLQGSEGPIIAVSDWMAGVVGQINRWTPRPMSVLGTDGFGRSDTREALRSFFEVDAAHVVVTVLNSLARDGEIGREVVADAITTFGIDPNRPDPAHPDTGATGIGQ
jgi:pyruvate dehydrogenase E1 component